MVLFSMLLLLLLYHLAVKLLLVVLVWLLNEIDPYLNTLTLGSIAGPTQIIVDLVSSFLPPLKSI